MSSTVLIAGIHLNITGILVAGLPPRLRADTRLPSKIAPERHDGPAVVPSPASEDVQLVAAHAVRCSVAQSYAGLRGATRAPARCGGRRCRSRAFASGRFANGSSGRDAAVCRSSRSTLPASAVELLRAHPVTGCRPSCSMRRGRRRSSTACRRARAPRGRPCARAPSIGLVDLARRRAALCRRSGRVSQRRSFRTARLPVRQRDAAVLGEFRMHTTEFRLRRRDLRIRPTGNRRGLELAAAHDAQRPGQLRHQRVAARQERQMPRPDEPRDDGRDANRTSSPGGQSPCGAPVAEHGPGVWVSNTQGPSEWIGTAAFARPPRCRSAVPRRRVATFEPAWTPCTQRDRRSPYACKRPRRRQSRPRGAALAVLVVVAVLGRAHGRARALLRSPRAPRRSRSRTSASCPRADDSGPSRR